MFMFNGDPWQELNKLYTSYVSVVDGFCAVAGTSRPRWESISNRSPQRPSRDLPGSKGSEWLKLGAKMTKDA